MSLQSLVIEADALNRNRVKQAMMALPLFGKSIMGSSIQDAKSRLPELSKIDVVFISDKLDRSSIGSFIEEMKQNPKAQDAAFVLIMSGGKNSNLAEGFLNGADGVLSEPYSVDTLKEITELAERVKKQRERIRAELGIQLLLKDIVNQVNNVASVQQGGLDPSRQLKKLEEIADAIEKLDPDLQERYLLLAVEEFQKVPVPEAPKLKEQYKGISNRVKMRLEKKLVS